MILGLLRRPRFDRFELSSHSYLFSTVLFSVHIQHQFPPAIRGWTLPWEQTQTRPNTCPANTLSLSHALAL